MQGGDRAGEKSSLGDCGGGKEKQKFTTPSMSRWTKYHQGKIKKMVFHLILFSYLLT